MEPTRNVKKLIKLGKISKAVVLPINFLKFNPEAKEVVIEEYPDKLVIKFQEEVKNVI